MYADARVLADDGELFAKIEAIFQVSDALLSLANYVEGGWRLQPLREALFSHAGADAAQEFEQASLAEQVEIVCVDVVGIVELGALLAGASPAVLDAGQAFSIEVRCAVCAGSDAARVLVCDDESGECGNAQEEPGGGERVLEEGETGGDE